MISSWRFRGAALLAVLAVAGLVAPGPASAITEKKLRKPITSSVAKTIKVNIDADTIVVDSQTDIITATGTVEVIYGPYRLNATKITYNQKTKVVTANGNVFFREKNGNKAYADQLVFDTGFRQLVAQHVKALLTNDTVITAQYTKRTEADGITVYTKSSYTACTSCKTRTGEPLWQIVSDASVYDKNERTLAHKNPKLKIAGHTVAALPYLKLPAPGVKRMTGFLPPAFKYTNYTGFGIVTPYFLNLAPNYDLTLRPFFTLVEGPVADVEWRHRLQSGVYNIRGYGVYQLAKQDSPFGDNIWRGAAETHGKFTANRDWDWGWDGLISSDKTFLRQYGYHGGAIAQNDVFLTGLWDQTYVNAEAYNFGSLLSSGDADQLPHAMPFLEAEHTFDRPVLGGALSWKVNAYALQRNIASSPFDTVDHGTDQSRFTAEATWKNELISDFGTVMTASAKLRADVLSSENVVATAGDINMDSRLRPSAGLDMRWPLIGSSSFGQSIVSPVAQVFAAANEKRPENFGNEDAITLNFDHTNIFLEDRFTGFDRYEGGIRANAGLTYNFFAANGAFARASIGESFHIEGENSYITRSGLEQSRSDLVAAFTIAPWNGISLGYEGRAEEDLSAINRQEASLGLSFDRISANASYLFIDKEPAYGRTVTEEYAAASAKYELSPGWYLSGSMKYDLQDYFFRQRGVGLEFDCECMNASLNYAMTQANETAEIDHRVTLSVELATIGGTSFSGRF